LGVRVDEEEEGDSVNWILSVMIYEEEGDADHVGSEGLICRHHHRPTPSIVAAISGWNGIASSPTTALVFSRLSLSLATVNRRNTFSFSVKLGFSLFLFLACLFFSPLFPSLEYWK
jgi:hypothetical protein